MPQVSPEDHPPGIPRRHPPGTPRALVATRQPAPLDPPTKVCDARHMTRGTTTDAPSPDTSEWAIPYRFMAGTSEPREYLPALRDAMTRIENERGKLRDQQKRAVKNAADAGVSDAEIARLVGVSRLTVRAWLGKSV